MKLLNILTLSLILTSCASKKDGPKVLWEQSTFKNPESAYFYPKTKHIYVSNVAGSPVAKDNDGWISKLDKDGKVIAPKWIMGLHAPKGLRANGDNLYVSDIDSLVIISIKQGKILKKIKVKGAKFLNDVAIDDKGNVYVSDMFTNKVHIYRNGKVKTFLNYKQLLKSSPNGLLVDANKLLVATWGKGLNKKDFSTKEAGRIISYDLKTKKLLTQTAPIGSLDGLERLDKSSLIVSDWMAGKVFKVSGKEVELIYTGTKGTADIGLIPGTRKILIPQMNKNTVFAYRF